MELVSIGNGTASRETDRLVLDLMKLHPELRLQKLVVSEAGASVYSASELASHELPSLDVSLRGGRSRPPAPNRVPGKTTRIRRGDDQARARQWPQVPDSR